jgi:hypothetical protein
MGRPGGDIPTGSDTGGGSPGAGGAGRRKKVPTTFG